MKIKLIRDLLMGFNDVAFLPPELVFHHITKNCGGGESLRTTACLETVIGRRQGHALCEILSLQQSFFL